MAQVDGCSCGNLKIKGRVLQPGSLPNIPVQERARFQRCVGCFVLQSKSLEIDEKDDLVVKCQSPACTDIGCAKCGTGYRIFKGRGCHYIGKLEEGPKPIPGKREEIPEALQYVVSHKSKPVKVRTGRLSMDDVEISSDADFVLMFANKSKLVVGSYKQHMAFQMANSILDGGLDEVPNSYYA